MKVREDIPPLVLSHLPHIIKALRWNLHRTLHSLQGVLQEVITAQFIRELLLQLLLALRGAAQGRILRTRWAIWLRGTPCVITGLLDVRNDQGDEDCSC